MKQTSYKIIHKQLGQLIRQSKLSNPKYRPKSLNTLGQQQEQPSKESLRSEVSCRKLGRSSSKHSIKNTPHLNVKVKTQAYHQPYQQTKKQLLTYVFNQIDVIFTQLQEYLYEMKEKTMQNYKSIVKNASQMFEFNPQKLKSTLNLKLKALTSLSSSFKSLFCQPQKNQKTQITLKQQLNLLNRSKSKSITKSNSKLDLESENAKISYTSIKRKATKRIDRTKENKQSSIYQTILKQNQNALRKNNRC